MFAHYLLKKQTEPLANSPTLLKHKKEGKRKKKVHGKMNNFCLLFFSSFVFVNAKEIELSSWMSLANSVTRDQPITTLAIPGSHDSFAYWFDLDRSWGPDSGEFSSVLSIASKMVGPTNLRQLLMRWSMTQTLDATGQLNYGVRFFDVRTSYDTVTDTFRIIHMLWSVGVEQEMLKIDEFLDNHPGEVVILDFNHFYQMTPQLHRRFIDSLLSIFGMKIISSKFWKISDLTLNNLAQTTTTKQQVVIIYHDPLGVEYSNEVFWSEEFISNPWPNKQNVTDLIYFLDAVRIFRFYF